MPDQLCIVQVKRLECIPQTGGVRWDPVQDDVEILCRGSHGNTGRCHIRVHRNPSFLGHSQIFAHVGSAADSIDPSGTRQIEERPD